MTRRYEKPMFLSEINRVSILEECAVDVRGNGDQTKRAKVNK